MDGVVAVGGVGRDCRSNSAWRSSNKRYTCSPTAADGAILFHQFLDGPGRHFQLAEPPGDGPLVVQATRRAKNEAPSNPKPQPRQVRSGTVREGGTDWSSPNRAWEASGPKQGTGDGGEQQPEEVPEACERDQTNGQADEAKPSFHRTLTRSPIKKRNLWLDSPH